MTAAEITSAWTTVSQTTDIEQYKLKVLSRRANTMIQKALSRIDEVTEDDRAQ
jgi:hypothetical protein